MDVKTINMQKLFAMLAQPKVELEPLKDIEKREIEIKYITYSGAVDSGKIWLYVPEKAKKPLPLVYVAHYEMPIDSLEIRDYLLAGFAVASRAEFKEEYNATLTNDDLIFNNAALYTLRNMTEIDIDRIAVVGGSAGGYMSLMLNAMQLGICCSVANGPICNAYFNFYRYFISSKKYNEKELLQAIASGEKDFQKLMLSLPIPFLGLVSMGGFTRGVETGYDQARWEAVSPTAFAECFCNPLYINQATSDILVPLDQLTHEFVYKKGGETLPEDFSNLMPDDMEGKLKYAFCERLDQSELNLFRSEPITDGKDRPYEFDKNKLFNVNICDEGAPESYASHNLGIANGRTLDIEYIKYYFSLTAAKTNILTPEKLILFAQRYEGKALQLVGHENVDDTLYGSLAVYRKEIICELKKWAKDKGKETLREIAKKAILLDGSYKKTLTEIVEKI